MVDVARVAVESPLPHLDRLFDFAIPPEFEEQALPGCRVRVRFRGRRVTGWLLERGPAEFSGELTPLSKVLGPPVLTDEVSDLCRRVAERYAGTLADVLRFAVPPRVAAVEKRVPGDRPQVAVHPSEAWRDYRSATGFLDAVGSRRGVSGVWTCHPHDDPGELLGVLCAHTAAAGRGAVVVVPDARDVARMTETIRRLAGRSAVVALTAELSARVRYRIHLDVLSGRVPIVVGTRSAVFTPMPDLGLLAVWDEGDASLAEPHTPGWHAREVAALRCWRTDASVLVGGFGRTPQAQAWVDNGWAADLVVDRGRARARRYEVRAVGEPDRDPQRVPQDAFAVIRTGLSRGPVLVQVPRRGGAAAVVCRSCGTVQRCGVCGGSLTRTQGIHCRTCGGPAADRCPGCGGAEWLEVGAGSQRSADQMRRAFPNTPIVRSDAASGVLESAGDDPCLVVATPGAEPSVPGGFQAAVILDPEVLLSLPSLRAPEEAARRWLAAISRTAPGAATFISGPAANPVIQALIRNDLPGLAERELQMRRDAGMPPATRVVRARASEEVLLSWIGQVRPVAPVRQFGPVGMGENCQVVLAAPPAGAPRLIERVRQVQAERSRSGSVPVAVRVDPLDLGAE